MTKLVTGELLALAATQIDQDPEDMAAVVWVTGLHNGSIGVIATEPLDPWTVVSMLAAGIERVVAGAIGLGSDWTKGE